MRPRTAHRRLSAVAVALTIGILATATTPAAASHQYLWWNDDGQTFRSFGPNASVTISQGQIEFACDGFFPAADIYVVQAGSVSGGGALTDVSNPQGLPNTVQGASGGLFIEETIAFTQPGGNLGAGTYAVVYDECQDGVFDSGQDALFDPALEVVIPANIPPIDPAIQALKDDAQDAADSWNYLMEAVETIELLIELKGWYECLSGGLAGCAVSYLTDQLQDFVKEAIMGALGLIDPQEAAKKAVIDTIKHYGGIAADPPDPQFQQLTRLAARTPLVPDEADPLAAAIVELGDAAQTEGALAQALLRSIERYQGADVAGNGDWALVHARAAAANARALAGELGSTDDALGALGAALSADGRDLDGSAAAAEPVRARIETSGFSGEERALLESLGLDAQQSADLRDDIAAEETAGFTEADTQTAIGAHQTLNGTLGTALDGFAADVDGLIAALEADAGTPDERPLADAGGPYTGAARLPVALDGSASNEPGGGAISAYAWDLDADGAFDDASAASPTHAFPRGFDGLVGLEVTDDDGQKGVGYAPASISDPNRPPTAEPSSPARPAAEVLAGGSQTFSVTPADPDGDPVAVRWLVDFADAGTGPSFLYAPGAADLGMHVVRAEVSDPFGGMVAREWGVQVLFPDADGDGWRSNVDCDDTDPEVNPGHAEVVLNGVDDDCNPATTDDGSPPVAFFNPTGGGRNVALLEAGATVVARSSQWDASHSPAAMLNFLSDDFYPWATGSGQTTNQWVKLTLIGAKTYLVDRVQVMPRSSCCPDQRVKDFEIWVSTTTTDDAAFTKVLSATAADNGNLQTFTLPRPALAKHVMYRPLNNRGSTCCISTQQLKILTGQEDGQTITFRNLASDVDGDLVTTSWDFGDGGTSTDAEPTHTFPPGPGTYPVKLTVEDSRAHVASFTLDQRVTTPPTGTINAGIAVPNEGQSVTYSVAGSDPDGGTLLARTIWDWGDGSSLQTINGLSAAHTFGDNGTYTVRVTVVDDEEQTAVLQRVVTPLNLPPNASVQTDSFDPANVDWMTPRGKNLAVGTSVSDPGSRDTLSCTWAFGDGTSSNACGFSHTYQSAGRFTATLTVRDDDGAVVTRTLRIYVFNATSSVPLTPISTTFNNPIGIDWHQPTNTVVVSVNYSGGAPRNFELIRPDGSHEPFSGISGLTDEVKIGTVRKSSCQGGFTPGELFTGNGRSGEVTRIAADGTSIQNPWIRLPGESGLMRGGLYQDRACVVGGDLVVVTTAGGVWRISSTRVASRIAHLSTHLEGVITLPDDPRYGPWAGKILTGAEGSGTIYAISPSGQVQTFRLGINPEDFDLIEASQNFFGVDFSARRIRGAPESAFTDKIGDVLIAQEFPGILWSVHWNPDEGIFESTEIARVGQWEHVTMAGAGIVEIPPTNRAAVATDVDVITDEDTPVDITLGATDPDGDPLTFSIVGDPAHGTLGPVSGNVVRYTPSSHYVGDDAFTFRASDGTDPSNVATARITVRAVNEPPAIAPIPDQVMFEGGTLEVPVAATDPDGDPLTLRAGPLPPFGTFTDNGDGTGVFRFTPGFDDAGLYPGLELRASDGQLESSRSFPLRVLNVNRPPVLTPIGDQALDEDTTLDVPVSATDPDGDPLTLNAAGLPPFATFTDNGDGTGVLRLAPGFADAGAYPGVRISASDGALEDDETITITVRDVNRPPVVTLDPAGPIDEGGEEALLRAHASDPDGDPLTFSWMTTLGTLTPTGDTATLTVDDGPAGAMVQVGVDDGNGGDASAGQMVWVRNVAPALDGGPDRGGWWGVPISFDPASITDPSDADTAAGFDVRWDPRDGSPVFAGPGFAHTYASPGAYTARGTATDKDGGEGADEVLVDVTRRGTSVAFTGPPSSTFGFTRLSGRLSDLVDAPTSMLAGREIAFEVGGSTYHALADANGDAVVPGTIPLPPGTHLLTTRFAGDDRYLASAATSHLVVASSSGKVTGGVQPDGGGSGGFVVNAIHPMIKGNLQFQKDALIFHADEMTALGIAPDRRSAWFAGHSSDGRTFVAYVEDNGEPGQGDVFQLWIDGSLVTGTGPLRGGNVQIHK